MSKKVAICGVWTVCRTCMCSITTEISVQVHFRRQNVIYEYVTISSPGLWSNSEILPLRTEEHVQPHFWDAAWFDGIVQSADLRTRIRITVGTNPDPNIKSRADPGVCKWTSITTGSRSLEVGINLNRIQKSGSGHKSQPDPEVWKWP